MSRSHVLDSHLDIATRWLKELSEHLDLSIAALWHDLTGHALETAPPPPPSARRAAPARRTGYSR